MGNDRFADGPRNLLLMLVSPTNVLRRTEKRPVWFVFVLLMIGTAIIRLSYFPFYKKLAISTLQSSPTQAQIAFADHSARSLSVYSATTSPLSLSLEVLFIAVVLWLSMQLVSGDPGFGRLLSLVVNCQLICFLGTVVTIAILFLRGPDAIHGLPDLSPSLGLDLLLRRARPNGIVESVAGYVNIFTIWWAVLMYMGIYLIAQISRAKALAISLFLWSFKLCVHVGYSILAGSLTKAS